MRTVTVENNKIVVEVDGAKVRYPLEIVRKRINSLLQDLEEWRNYERLLTQRALDSKQACRSCELGLCPDGQGGFIPCTFCGRQA